MIGNWVKIKGDYGKPLKITTIDDTYNSINYFDGDAEGELTLQLNEIEPIPLTPEILGKNGWKHEFDKKDYMVKYNLGEEGKNCWMMWAIKEHNLDIQRQDKKLDVYNLKVSKVAIPCDYVHQLQHALRLCGIEKEIEL